MADENQQKPEEENQSEVAPSTLFLEMMRRAAREAELRDSAVEEANLESIPESEAALSFEQVFSENQAEEEEIEEIEEASPEESLPEFEEAIGLSVPESETAVEVPPNIDSRIPIYEAPTISREERQARLEEQRIQRIRRRRERQFRRRVGIFGGFFRTIFVSLLAAVLASTIFMWFMDAQSINPSVGSLLYEVDSTSAVVLVDNTATPAPVTPNYLKRIGIVAGHHGPENDSGAVCPDGLQEVDVNFAVAQLVVRALREKGYSVDLLDEFDPRLKGYQAATLVSIHSNDCREYPGGASGFLVARAASRPSGGPDDILTECIARYYQAAAKIPRRAELTIDMTDYHSFREINGLTPAAIIELGFLHDDRQLLTEHQGELAEGVAQGIVCFLNGENPLADVTATSISVDVPTETPSGG